MSFGNRIASRGRAAIRSNLTSTPREPLLFLYPEWSKKSSKAYSNEAFSSTARDTTIASPDATVQPLGNEASAPDDNGASLKGPSQSGPKDGGLGSNPPRIRKIKHEYDSVAEAQAAAKMRKGLSPQEFSSSVQGRLDGGGRIHFFRTLGPPRFLRKIPSLRTDGEINDGKETVFERFGDTKVRKIITSSEKAELAREHQKKLRKIYNQEKQDSWDPDWRVVLDDMITHTPQYTKYIENAVIVTVPQDAMASLFHDIDDNLWELSAAHDCRVAIGPRDADTLSPSTLILSGSATGISKTTADALRLAPSVKISTVEKLTTEEKSTLEVASPMEGSATQDPEDLITRHVTVTPKYTIQNKRPDEIRKPDEWTTSSFLDHVNKLAHSVMSNHMIRLKYRHREGHVEAVLAALDELFENPDHKPFISRAAAKVALTYFIKTNRIDRARKLYVCLELMNMRMHPEVYNILLQGSAKAEDLHNFHYILHLMIRKGFQPNSRTWVLFMISVEDTRIRMMILKAMTKKGLVQDHKTRKEICGLVAFPKTLASIDKNQSQAQFLAHMDAQYGSGWLTVGTSNQILNALGSRGLISRCWQFFQVMISRYLFPDLYSLNTVLHHCKEVYNIRGALEFLNNLPDSFNTPPNEETYRILFDMAWETRSYNMCRVIWRYACLTSQTTFMMRDRVFSSLRDFPRTGAKPLFSHDAGEFIIGIHKPGEHPTEIMEREPRTYTIKRLSDLHTARQEHIERKLREYETARPGRIVTLPSVSKPRIQDENKVEDEVEKENEDTTDPESQPNHIPKEPRIRPTISVAQNRHYMAKHLTKLDQDTFKWWKPVLPIYEILTTAYELDEKWKFEEMQLGEKKEMPWRLADGIHVPIRGEQPGDRGVSGDEFWLKRKYMNWW